MFKLLLLSLLGLMCAVDVESGRIVVASIRSSRHGPWGTWRYDQFCPSGSFADGIDVKIEAKQGSKRDDTALNRIRLYCRTKNTRAYTGYIHSGYEKWGNWQGTRLCYKNDFLVGFKLQVESDQGSRRDDTAVNGITMGCRSFGSSSSRHGTELKFNGHWGHYGSWKHCPKGSAICGIRTRVEADQGRHRDDTALNDVIFYCCRN